MSSNLENGVIVELIGRNGAALWGNERISFKAFSNSDHQTLAVGDSIEFTVVDLGSRKIATNVKKVSVTNFVNSPNSYHPVQSSTKNRQPTPRGLRFNIPDRFLTTKKSSFRGVKIYDIPNWKITVRSSNSPDIARLMIIELAESLGANGLIDMIYHKSTGNKGNYRYSIHHFTATPVILILPNNAGQYTEKDLVDLNANLESAYNAQAERKETRYKLAKNATYILSAVGAASLAFDTIAVVIVCGVLLFLMWNAYLNFKESIIRL